MKNAADKSSSPSSWRNIKQNVSPRPITSIGRKRQNYAMIKTVAIVVVLALCAWGAYEIYVAWEHNPNNVKSPVKSEPLRHYTVRTDGVLDQEWVIRTLNLPKNVGMMELDLMLLRARLLANPQIRTAVLARQFPDTLSVLIEERSPVARIVVQHAPGEIEELLVARDGTVFAGANFKPETLALLPYLANASMRRAAPGSSQFEPLDGIDMVADLVATARGNIPNLYASWKSISLGRYVEDRVLVVNVADKSQIIFGIRDDFYTQIARLDWIMDNIETSAPNHPPVRTIDLSVGKTASGIQVPVTFDTPPPTNTLRPTRPGATAPTANPAGNTLIFRQ